MRKLLISLPIATILLAAGVLLVASAGTFASNSSEQTVVGNNTPATTAPVVPAGDKWQETGKGNRSTL